MEERKINGYVKFTIFIWAIGILLTLFIFSVSLAGNALSKASDNKTNIQSLETDIKWIRETLTEIKNKL